MKDNSFAALAWILHIPGGVWASIEKKGELSLHHGRQSFMWGIASIAIIFIAKYVPQVAFMVYPDPDIIFILSSIANQMFLITYIVNLVAAFQAVRGDASKIPLAYPLMIRFFGAVKPEEVKGDIIVLKEKHWLKELRYTLFKAGLSPEQITNVLSHQLSEDDVRSRLLRAGLDKDTADALVAGHLPSEPRPISMLKVILLWIIAFALGFLLSTMLIPIMPPMF